MRMNEAMQFGQEGRAKLASAPTVESETTGQLDISELRRVTTDAHHQSQNLEYFRRSWDGAIPDDKLDQAKPIAIAPQYGKSHIMDFSILALIILVEGLANAYFFSKASDLGLLGGWMQAITVSGTNVLAAFFLAGFVGLRLTTNPHRPARMVAGWALFILTAVALYALNMSAAQYRDLLEIHSMSLAVGEVAPQEMFLSAHAAQIADAAGAGAAVDPSAFYGAQQTTSMGWGPFSLQTLEARLLFLLGMTFAVIAAYKGYSFSDPIMGYTKIADKTDKALQEMNRLTRLPKDKLQKLSEADREQLAWAEEVRDELSAVLNGPMRAPGKADEKADDAL